MRDAGWFYRFVPTLVLALGPLAPLAAEPQDATLPQPSAVLAQLMELNPHLATDDPRELPMKLRGLLRGEAEFFEGTADLFYLWCARHCSDWLEQTEGMVPLHGDAHLGNIGAYQAVGKMGRDIYFGVRHLDETVRGPVQLDLLRAMTSLRFVASSNALPASQAIMKPVVQELCSSYVSALQGQTSAARVVARSPQAAALLAKARKGKMARCLTSYCRKSEPPRFKPVRMKKKTNEVAGLMERVDQAERERVAAALWSYFHPANSSGASRRFRYEDRHQFQTAVLDVARWTRPDGGTRQGLTKYLILLEDPFVGSDFPVILQLIEEPAPAAARAGILAGSSGPARAREIARAYGRLQLPPAWFVGALEIGGQGFLLGSINPWGETPSARDFSTSASLVEAAGLLGAVLGSAQRRCLADPVGDAETVARLLADAEDVLLLRSAEVEGYLSEQFRLLQADPVAQGYVEQAKAFIQGHAKPGRG